MKNFIIPTLIFYLATTCIGCSPLTSNNSDITNEGTANSGEQNTDSDIFPVIILQPKEENEQKGGMNYYIGLAFIDSNGEYLLFDNDGDYTYLCRNARIVGNICHEMLSELQRRNINKIEDTQYWDTIIIPRLKALPEYVRQYFYGNKDSIQTDIYELIDRYNYNNHPLDVDYSPRESSYNEKVYGAPYSLFSLNNYLNMVFVPAKKLHDTLKGASKCIDLDGNELPITAVTCEAPLQ